MNLLPRGDAFANPLSTADEQITVEQTLLAQCLARPERIGEVAARVVPNDLQNEFHRAILSVLVDLHEQGRSPSVEALVARFGDDEIEPGLTPRRYLNTLLKSAIENFHQPMADIIEVVKDAAIRRTFADIGNSLSLQSTSHAGSIVDLAHGVMDRMGDVLASLRSGSPVSYDALEAVDMALRHLDSESPPYPTTGLCDLDRVTGGLPTGQSSILAARPGMGKSAVASSMAARAAMKGYSVLFFSLEMDGKQLGARFIADLAWNTECPVYYEDILRRRKDAFDERKRRLIAGARQKFVDLPIRLIEQPQLTFAEITAMARKHANQLERSGRKLDLLIIDHILLVKASDRYRGNRVREVSEISNGLAALAKELQTSVLGLCQLNRGVEGRENKRPSLADLKDSGTIEEDASLVMFLYRPAYYLEQQRFDDPEMEQARLSALDASRHSLEFIVAKNRNGRLGTVDAFIDIGANAVRNAGVSYGIR